MSFKLLKEYLIFKSNEDNYTIEEREIIRNEFRKELNNKII